MPRRTRSEAEETRQQIMEAARRVFRARGVARSTLELIAREAGVTRGAVYWHFQDKEELFNAVRAVATMPLLDELERSLLDESKEDPLTDIELSLLHVLKVLEGDLAAREAVQIMLFGCEYVGEFASLLGYINAVRDDLTLKFEGAYGRAAERGLLRADLLPALLARDTMAFLIGTVDRWLAGPAPLVVTDELRRLIVQHVALRRA